MLLNCEFGEDSWQSRGLHGDQTINSKGNTEHSLEGLMLKLKPQYFGHLMWRGDSLEKTLMLGKTEGRRRRGWDDEDEKAGWHHQLNGHEFEQALGDGEGQGSLVCCSPWGHKDSDTTERLSNMKAAWDKLNLPENIAQHFWNIFEH